MTGCYGFEKGKRVAFEVDGKNDAGGFVCGELVVIATGTLPR